MDIFTTMKYFPELTKLYLTLYSKFKSTIPIRYTSEELQQCQQLTHFTLYCNNLSALNDHFFVGIGDNIPNLKHLELWKANISGQALDLLSKTKRLQRLKLCARPNIRIWDYHVHNLMASCRLLREIELNNIEPVNYQ